MSSCRHALCRRSVTRLPTDRPTALHGSDLLGMTALVGHVLHAERGALPGGHPGPCYCCLFALQPRPVWGPAATAAASCRVCHHNTNAQRSSAVLAPVCSSVDCSSREVAEQTSESSTTGSKGLAGPSNRETEQEQMHAARAPKLPAYPVTCGQRACPLPTTPASRRARYHLSYIPASLRSESYSNSRSPMMTVSPSCGGGVGWSGCVSG